MKFYLQLAAITLVASTVGGFVGAAIAQFIIEVLK